MYGCDIFGVLHKLVISSIVSFWATRLPHGFSRIYSSYDRIASPPFTFASERVNRICDHILDLAAVEREAVASNPSAVAAALAAAASVKAGLD